MKSHFPKNGFILCKNDTYAKNYTTGFSGQTFCPYLYVHAPDEWRRSISLPHMMLISLSLDSLIGIFGFFLCIEKKGRVYTSGLGASLTWESTPSKSSCTPEWGQAWTGRALLGAPVLLPLQTGCQQRTHPPLPARDWTQTRLTTSSIS